MVKCIWSAIMEGFFVSLLNRMIDLNYNLEKYYPYEVDCHVNSGRLSLAGVLCFS